MAMQYTKEQILDDILAQHILYNEELLVLVKREKKSIIYNDVKDIELIMEKKITLKNKISELEKKRMLLIPQFQYGYNIAKQPVKLEDIIKVVEKKYSDVYKEKRQKLRCIVEAIQKAHEVNKKLIQRSIAFQEKTFMLLFGLNEQHAAYGANGKVDQKSKPLFNCNA